jgi:hypothetical protein
MLEELQRRNYFQATIRSYHSWRLGAEEIRRYQLSLLDEKKITPGTVAIRMSALRAVESSSKVFNCADVVTYGSLCVIKTLEFFQHPFDNLPQ